MRGGRALRGAGVQHQLSAPQVAEISSGVYPPGRRLVARLGGDNLSVRSSGTRAVPPRGQTFVGGVFAIGAVIDHFSDAIVQNPIVGQRSENPALREWHTNNQGRLPGLKFMHTLKQEVLAFAAHKVEVTEGYKAAVGG